MTGAGSPQVSQRPPPPLIISSGSATVRLHWQTMISAIYRSEVRPLFIVHYSLFNNNSYMICISINT